MSWLLPCWRSIPPLAVGLRLGEFWLSGRGASPSPSLLLLSSPLPEELAESEELLLLLICSIISTSARSSVDSNKSLFHISRSLHFFCLYFNLSKYFRFLWFFFRNCLCKTPILPGGRTFSPLLMSSSWGSGEGLSFDGEGEGEVLIPVPGLVGARNWELGWLERTDCCSIRAWILLLPSALLAHMQTLTDSSTQDLKDDTHLLPKTLEIQDTDISPCFLNLDAAAKLLQNKFACVVINDEHAVLLIWPLVSFKYCHWRSGALKEKVFI